MSLDLTKPVKTRDGRKVRILCTDAECTNQDVPQPIVGIVAGEFSGPKAWCANGSYFGDRSISECDLVNVPPLKKKALVTVRLYRCPQSGVYPAVAMEGQPQAWCTDYIAQHFIEMEYEEQP